MKLDNAIEVKNISKKFKVYLDKGHTLKEKMIFSNRRKYQERVVLDDISFEVKKGEAIGLIGQNGCGKSTTLKLLTRIMYPDSGSIEMTGRVSSLIELGAGFHPDMSGRQNIYTNASIFGLTRKEIDRRFDDIVAFSELEKFIDNPVRTYSSGMYMRLAFAVAINVDAEILLIDEILAVGDANFQAKCFNKLREIKANGTTIVIVSHSLGQIEQICERSLWIHEGMIKEVGSPREVHPHYMDFMGVKRQEIIEKEEERQAQKDKDEDSEPLSAIDLMQDISNIGQQRWGNGDIRITDIRIRDSKGNKKTAFKTNDTVIFQVDYQVNKKVEEATFGIGIFRSDGVYCYGTNTRIDQFEKFDISCDGTFEFEIKSCSLLPGVYNLDFAIESGQGTPIDYFTKACHIELYSNLSDVGISRLEHKWKIQ